jgi:5'-nucleotidase
VRNLLYLLLIISLPISFPALGAQNLRILLTNDDGFDSPGIIALHKALVEAGHDVYVIAPATQQSGASASVSARGVKVTEHPNQVWAVHGRPADAVRVGLGNIMFNEPPDLVVSGANFGQNTGQDVNISGTVGAAITALRLGVPAIAVSVAIKLEEANRGFPSTASAFSGAARLVTRLIDQAALKDFTAVLNVNYPAELPLDVRGVRWTKLSTHSILGKRYNRQADGSYAPELKGPSPHARAQDAESVLDGFVTLTFLDGDMSVSTQRNQKYLDGHLLDRAYTNEYVVPKPKPRRKKLAPEQSVTSTSTENTLSERKPLELSIKLQEMPESKSRLPIAGVPIDKTHKQTSAPVEHSSSEQIPVQESRTIAATEPRDNPEATDSAEPEALNPNHQTKKKKPESWLRRMFDPSSWRR